MEFCYAAIEATERQTEDTEEFMRGLFDPEESRAIRREVDYKSIMYNKYNDDEHNEQWLTIINWLMYLKRNESNEN